MLDTIILQIPIYPFDKIDHDRFSPSTRDIFNNLAGFAKFINNPNKLDKDSGIYKPRLTMLKRAKKVYLKVEFSAPKLLFGNNLDEAEESDFNAIVCRLKDLISDMGVQLLDYQIKDAEVIGLHPSKNIKISKPYTSSFIIRELSKINLSKRLDLTKVSFQNDGESLQLYSNSYSIVIYDKISDLSKPPKRATDKDATTKQLGLFEEIKKNNDDLEILRIEIRLSKMPKLKEVLKNIEYYDKPILKNLFSKVCVSNFTKASARWSLKLAGSLSAKRRDIKRVIFYFSAIRLHNTCPSSVYNNSTEIFVRGPFIPLKPIGLRLSTTCLKFVL